MLNTPAGMLLQKPLIFAGLLFVTHALEVRAAVVPFEFEANALDGGQIFLPCVYDSFSSRCFFDSGSDDNNVAYNNTTQSLPVIRQTTFWGAGGVKKTCAVVNIESWITGQFYASNVEAVRCSDSVPSDTLGINFFSKTRFSLSIDMTRIETDITFPSSVPTQPLKVYNRGHISMNIEIAGKPFEAMWDTGAGDSAVDQTLISEMPQAFHFIQDIPSGHDSTGAPVSVKLYTMTGLSMGGISIPETNVLAIDFSKFAAEFSPNMRLVLGPNAMKARTWFIDIPSRKWAAIAD